MQVPMNPAESLLNFIVHHTDLYLRRKKKWTAAEETAAWHAQFHKLLPWLKSYRDKVRAEAFSEVKNYMCPDSHMRMVGPEKRFCVILKADRRPRTIVLEHLDIKEAIAENGLHSGVVEIHTDYGVYWSSEEPNVWNEKALNGPYVFTGEVDNSL